MLTATFPVKVRHKCVTFPRRGSVRDNQVFWKNVCPNGDALQKAIPSKVIIVTTKAMILNQRCERRRSIRLAKQGVVGGNSVGAEEQDSQSVSTMLVGEILVAFQYLQEPIGLHCGRNLVCATLWQIVVLNMRGPAMGDKIVLLQLKLRKAVVTAKTTDCMLHLSFVRLLCYTVVHVNKTVRAVC